MNWPNVAVITGIFGNYDLPKPHPQVAGVHQWVMVTDNSDLEAPGWTVRHYDPPGSMHPRLAAKLPKFCPWLFIGATHSIWIDGSARVNNVDSFVPWALGDAELSLYRHPERTDIHGEADVSRTMAKYADLPVVDQVKSYGKGVPDLWATGFIARKHSSAKVRELGHLWFEECCKWTYQDQLSLPYLLQKLDLQPRALEGTLWDRNRIVFSAHQHDL